MIFLTLVSAHAAPFGVSFEAADRSGRVHRFTVSALALDELERGHDAPSDWMRAFRAHESRILEAAGLAIEGAEATDGPIVLGMASFPATPMDRMPPGAMPFDALPFDALPFDASPR